MTLGTRLKTARVIKGFGLREAANAAGLSASTLSRIERDKTEIGYKHLWRLAEYYGVLVVDLVAPDDAVREMTSEEVDKFLIAHGYNLDELDKEIHSLIEKLKNEAAQILLSKEVSDE